MKSTRFLSPLFQATLLTTLLGFTVIGCESKPPTRPDWAAGQADGATSQDSGNVDPGDTTGADANDTAVKNDGAKTTTGTQSNGMTTGDATKNTGTGTNTAGNTTAGSTNSTSTSTSMGNGSTNASSSIDPSLKALNDIPAPEKGKGVLVRVANKCPFPLWVHAAGAQGALMPDDSKLDTNTVRSYLAPILWQSGRVEVYKKGPREDNIDKVEMTFDHPGSTVNLNYNVTYVDWVGLPVNVSSIGSGKDCKASGCSKPVGQILNGCPDGLNDGERCISARTYCLNPVNQGKPYCHLLDDKVAECIANHDDCKNAMGAGTPEVYACSGKFFSENPKYCAAINRGMLDDPMNANTKLYYTKGPFNSYSKWVHETCPNIYALAYDDFPPAAEESGYHSCVDGNELDITFCPGG